MRITHEYLKSIYKKHISSKIEELDCSTIHARNEIYEAAVIAQKRINAKNNDISDSEKKERLSILQSVIRSKEQEFKNSDDKFEVLNPNIRYFFYCLILFLLTAATAIYFFLKPEHDIEINSDNKLPIEFVFSDKIFETVVARGAGKITKSKDKPQFIYSLENTKQNELQAVDTIFRDAVFVKQMQSKTDPILLTLELQKISDKALNIEILAYGIGATSKQSFRIYDNNLNEINLATNLKTLKKERNNILIRLAVKPDATSNDNEVQILFKKISFNEF